MKPYNSFCVDELNIGGVNITDLDSMSTDEFRTLNSYLQDHGLQRIQLKSLLEGGCGSEPRRFLPLKSQAYHGKVIRLHQRERKEVEAIEIEVDRGINLGMESLLLNRSFIYAYGYWLGKADLAYVLDIGDSLLFEVDGTESRLAWLGTDEAARPRFNGFGESCLITEKMNAQLFQLTSTKGINVPTFRALVEGRLPPKSRADETIEVKTSDGSVVNVDKETLEQAAALKALKDSMTSDKEEAVKAFMKTLLDKNDDVVSKWQDEMRLVMTKKK